MQSEKKTSAVDGMSPTRSNRLKGLDEVKGLNIVWNDEANETDCYEV